MIFIVTLFVVFTVHREMTKYIYILEYCIVIKTNKLALFLSACNVVQNTLNENCKLKDSRIILIVFLLKKTNKQKKQHNLS